jgi:hypothetical protein
MENMMFEKNDSISASIRSNNFDIFPQSCIFEERRSNDRQSHRDFLADDYEDLMLFSRQARAEEFRNHSDDKEIIRPMMIDEMLGFNTTCVSPNADGLIVD